MTVAIVGAGVMGEAVLAGLLAAGRAPADLLVIESRSERAAELGERYGVEVVGDVAATERADTILLVVKPQDVPAALDGIADAVRPGQRVVSLAAGITTASIEARLADGVAVIRVMPNTPALVGEGMAAIAGGNNCSESGSGCRRGAVGRYRQGGASSRGADGRSHRRLGFRARVRVPAGRGDDRGRGRARASRRDGERLAIQTVIGSAEAAQGDRRSTRPCCGARHVTRRDHCRRPEALEEHKLREIFATALASARDRSRELARGIDG